LHIRLAIAEDIPAMMDLERQAPTAAHWPPQQYESLLRLDPRSSGRIVWVVENDHQAQSDNVTRTTSQILAFLVTHFVSGEWELENIVVEAKSRRKGLGALLMGKLIAQARTEQGENLFLEVRESNRSACAFYEKLGFARAGVRKNYYANPREDAILYRLKLR
jgi:[ribosomal protein S18]-alanine N-acetyltransferase